MKSRFHVEARLRPAIIFPACAASIFILWLYAQLAFTPYYFILHFLFGLCMPFLWAGFNLFWIGTVVTFCSSIHNEFIADALERATYRVDWDHFAADIAGLLFSILLYRIFFSRKQRERKP